MPRQKQNRTWIAWTPQDDRGQISGYRAPKIFRYPVPKAGHGFGLPQQGDSAKGGAGLWPSLG
jgi:hypothetical protein